MNLLSQHAEKTARLSYLRRQRLEQTLNIFHQLGGNGGFAKSYSLGLAQLGEHQVKSSAEDLFRQANDQIGSVAKGVDAAKRELDESVAKISERLGRFETTVIADMQRQSERFSDSLQELRGLIPKDLKDSRIDTLVEEFKDIKTVSNLTLINYLIIRYETASADFNALPYFSKLLPTPEFFTKIKAEQSPLSKLGTVLTSITAEWRGIEEAFGRVFSGVPPSVFDGGELPTDKKKEVLGVIASIVALNSEVDQQHIPDLSKVLNEYKAFQTKVGGFASLQGKEATVSAILALFEAVYMNGTPFESDKFSRLMTQLG